MLDLTSGYGYRPWLALIWMVLFAGFGYGVFTHGKGSFLPIREQPKFVAGKPVVSLGYPKFDPLIYSLDTLVPFANLGQRDYWAPNRSRDGGRLSWFYRPIHVLLGWFFATIFVGAVTGLIRRD